MSDLQSLARQKATAAMELRMRELPVAIEALKRKLAAQGGLRSGTLLKQITALCQDTLKSQGETLTTEYRWAVSQALLVTQAWVLRLVVEARESLAPLYQACIAHVRQAVAFVDVPRAEPQFLAELRETYELSHQAIDLALRSAFAERKRGLARLIPGFVGRAITRLFGGGHT